MKVSLLPQAYADIDRLQDFLLDKNVKAALRVHDLLFDAAASLSNAPRKGRLLRKDVRELIVRFGKGAYILRYRLDRTANAVVILRVWHSRERRGRT